MKIPFSDRNIEFRKLNESLLRVEDIINSRLKVDNLFLAEGIKILFRVEIIPLCFSRNDCEGFEKNLQLLEIYIILLIQTDSSSFNLHLYAHPWVGQFNKL